MAEPEFLKTCRRGKSATPLSAAVGGVVSTLGSGSSLATEWEFDSPLRHQWKVRLVEIPAFSCFWGRAVFCRSGMTAGGRQQPCPGFFYAPCVPWKQKTACLPVAGSMETKRRALPVEERARLLFWRAERERHCARRLQAPGRAGLKIPAFPAAGSVRPPQGKPPVPVRQASGWPDPGHRRKHGPDVPPVCRRGRSHRRPAPSGRGRPA